MNNKLFLMQKLILLSCVFLFSYYNSAKKPGQQLLEKAIAYHDPQNNWAKLKTHLYLSSTDTAGKESPFDKPFTISLPPSCVI